MTKCYCGSDRSFAECCQPFLERIAKPMTAEQLMRSRYSAYASLNIDYLIKTTHPSTRKFHNSESVEQWAKSNSWQKLEIISTEKGTAKDSKGTVEFKAHFLDSNAERQIHHELSRFRKELGIWFFVDGETPKT